MDKSDPFGLYRALGLTPAATTEELERAVKYPFFVRSGDESDKPFEEALRLAPVAYDILTDPARKANYDWFARNLPEADGETDWASMFDLRSIVDGPTHCSSCGRVTPLPRYVTISEVTGSLHTYARTTSEEGLLCADCAALFTRKSALTTLFSGFLSKGGPYKATWSWLKNGQRGHHLKATDERLALHNARAYLERHDVKLAYALAKISARSKDEHIAGQSVSIMQEIEAAGGDYRNYRLPDPWAVPAGERAVYAVLPFAILTAFIAWVYYDTAQRTEPAHYPSAKEDRVDAQFCAHPPETSEVLTRQASAQGDLTLRFRNASGHKAIVKVRDRKSALVATLFLRGRDSIDLSGLPGGNYRIQFSLGSMLDPTCKAFLDTGAIFELNEFNKRVISSFSTGREIIGYDLEADVPTHRRLSQAEFEQGD